MRLLPTLLLAASLSITATYASDPPLSSEELRVGRTNIFCVQMPCPWRGIAAADSPRMTPVDLMWSLQTLPPIDASSGDREQIVTAWNSDQCLVVNGVFVDGVLRVDRIAGACS